MLEIEREDDLRAQSKRLRTWEAVLLGDAKRMGLKRLRLYLDLCRAMVPV